MLGSTFVETAIGLSLLYLMLSLMSSIAVEWVAKQLELRARLLRSTITEMVGADACRALYDHQLIKPLCTVRWWARPWLWTTLSALFRRRTAGPIDLHLPSYIPSSLFAAVAKDSPSLAAKVPAGDGVAAKWFDDVMARLTARYKRLSQTLTLLVAIPLVCAVNADTIVIANRLQRDKALRDTVVASASTFVKDHPELATPAAASSGAEAHKSAPDDAATRFSKLAIQLDELSLPIGWPTPGELQKAEKAESDAAARDTAAAQAASAAEAEVTRTAALDQTQAEKVAATQDTRRKKAGDLRAAQRRARDDPSADTAKGAANAQADLADAQAEADEARADAEVAKAKADAAKANRDQAAASADAAKVGHRAATLANEELRSRALANQDRRRILARLIGWLLTALAVSLGASFWFDTLGKLFNIRGGGEQPRPEKRS